MDTETNKWINRTVKFYKDRLTHYIKIGKSEEVFIEDYLKMLKIIEYFYQNNLVQNVENIRDTKCEIHYNVCLVHAEQKSLK